MTLKEERRALRARIGLAVKMLTTGGYAMMGGPFFEHWTKDRTLPAESYLWAAGGIAALGFALYLSPHGASDRDDD